MSFLPTDCYYIDWASNVYQVFLIYFTYLVLPTTTYIWSQQKVTESNISVKYTRELSWLAEDHTISSAELNWVEAFVKFQQQPPHRESCGIFNRIIQAMTFHGIIWLWTVDYNERWLERKWIKYNQQRNLKTGGSLFGALWFWRLLSDERGRWEAPTQDEPQGYQTCSHHNFVTSCRRSGPGDRVVSFMSSQLVT